MTYHIKISQINNLAACKIYAFHAQILQNG